MHAPLRLGLWHALHPVSSALVLEHRVGAVALDRERVLALAGVKRLDLEAEALGVARRHALEAAGPETPRIPAGAALNLDENVLVVVGVARDHRDADLLLELGDPLARRG